MTQIYEHYLKDTPEIRGMLEVYKLQEHRIELNGCEMLYNGKPFGLGMTVKELIKVFGDYDYFGRGYYVWEKIGIVAARDIDDAENTDANVRIFNVYLNIDTQDHDLMKNRKPIKEDFFLIEGNPIGRNVRIGDFISNSHYELSDFSVSTMSYELDYDCPESSTGVRYMLMVRGGWIYRGSGHLMTKSHLNTENDNKVGLVSVFVPGD